MVPAPLIQSTEPRFRVIEPGWSRSGWRNLVNDTAVMFTDLSQ